MLLLTMRVFILSLYV